MNDSKIFYRGNKQATMVLEDKDAVIEILSRLPLKSLLKFKCVCKWWYDMISDPIFVANYTRRNPQHFVSGLFLQKYLFLELYSELEFIQFGGQTDGAPEPSLSFIKDDNGVCIQHSCNGLLICSSFRCHDKERRYYICKPTTKQYFALPNPHCENLFGINIAFDPDRSSHYQVICICDSKVSPNHRQIKIYNSETGSWGHSGRPFIASDELLFSRGVFWKGALHWVGKGKLSLCFDVKQELLLEMPMPPIHGGRRERRLLYFGESGGHLYLIEYDPQTIFFDVLEMKTDYSGWIVKYHVNLTAMAQEYPEMVREDASIIHRFVFSVLYLVHQQQGEEEEPFMLLHIPGKFILYDLRNNAFVELEDVPPRLKIMNRRLGLKYRWEEVFPYTDTLCCI